jgi:hypothetical protein
MLQGEDFTLTVTVKDSTDNLVDLTDAAVQKVKAHVFVGYKQVAIYALNTEEGFLPMVLDGDNKIVMNFKRANTANFPTGTMSVTVAVTRTDAEFPLGKVTKYLTKNIAELLQDNSIPIV